MILIVLRLSALIHLFIMGIMLGFGQSINAWNIIKTSCYLPLANNIKHKNREKIQMTIQSDLKIIRSHGLCQVLWPWLPDLIKYLNLQRWTSALTGSWKSSFGQGKSAFIYIRFRHCHNQIIPMEQNILLNIVTP